MDFCLRSTVKEPTSWLHFWCTILGYTSGLNLAADLGPVLGMLIMAKFWYLEQVVAADPPDDAGADDVANLFILAVEHFQSLDPACGVLYDLAHVSVTRHHHQRL